MSSAAILAVYAAGYFKTESAADQVAAPQAPAPVVATPTPSPDSAFLAQAPIATPVPTAVQAQIAQARGENESRQARGEDDEGETASVPTAPVPTATSVPPTVAAPKTNTIAPKQAAPKPTATPTSRYRDGKFTGTGSSRHGDVQATVVIKGGKIVSANIDGCMTRYPCSVIRDLPGEVVQQQSANVDFISGASDSSSAYQEAVASALSQAQAT